MMRRLLPSGIILAAAMITLLGTAAPCRAGEIRVAVVSSFLDTMTAIAEVFKKETGHRVLLTDGSTGELYARILNQVPFEVFLSSDDLDAKSLEEDGFAVEGTRFTYALGRLTLWSPDPTLIGRDGLMTLRTGHFTKFVISNSKTSAYGQAAAQALKALGVWELLQDQIVEAENSRQAFEWVAEGKSEMGLVPLGEVLDPDVKEKGSRWDVPAELYSEIRLEAVLLQPGKNNPAAAALLQFLKSEESRRIIQRFGYGLP